MKSAGKKNQLCDLLGTLEFSLSDKYARLVGQSSIDRLFKKPCADVSIDGRQWITGKKKKKRFSRLNRCP